MIRLVIGDRFEVHAGKFLLALITAYTGAVVSASQVVSLDAAYEAALKVEDYRLSNQSVKEQSRSRLNQAKSYLYPSLTAEGQYTDTRFKNKNTDVETETRRKTVGLNLRQPLFQGGLFSGIQRENANVEVTDLEIQKTNLDLYLTVSQTYHRIVLLESTLDVLKEIEKVSTKRVELLRKRVSIGKSKQVDFLTNELQNQSIKIQLGQIETDLSSEREVFARLTSFSKNVSLQSPEVTETIKPLDYYLNKISKTPEIQIQEKNLFIAEKNESIARAQHLPELYLDLDARYGELSSTQEGREYAAQLTLEIPLFEGGRVKAETSEARWKKHQERAKLMGLKKDTEVEIRNQHGALTKNFELFKIYEKSLETARKNYQLYNRELSLGLVSNLELLNSLNNYLEAKKNREESFYELKLLELKLAQLVGDKN